MKKTILITWASSWFGLVLATKLHENGYEVIGTSRDPKKIKVPFKMLPLDVSDDNSIKSFSKELLKNITKIDILINNAGYNLWWLAEETTIEQWKALFETNFWWAVKLTNELLPQFRKQRFGKIITVGSIMWLLSFPYTSYYSSSKHALEWYFKSLRFELKEFNIKVAMIEPMAFKTNIFNAWVVADKKINDYDTYRRKIKAFEKDLFQNAPESSSVIKTFIKLIEEKNPTFTTPVWKGSKLLLTIQLFSYKLYENMLIKNINKFKNN